MTPIAARLALVLARDAAGVGGAVAIAYGAGLIYAPAGWIVGGALTLGAALLAARSSS